MSLRVTLLGTGTSHGVPMIGCACPVCTSPDPRDRRGRQSILIEYAGEAPLVERPGEAPVASAFAGEVRTVLVDTSTDLRAQALANGIRRVDALLYTHSHADHILGLDEVRRFNILQRSAIPAYGDARTIEDLQRSFFYIFTPSSDAGGGVPQIRLSRIGGPFTLGGMEVVPIPLLHGGRLILGYRIGDFAYLTDCNGIPDESWPLLSGVRTLVLDALRDRPHPTHFSLSQAIEAAARIGASRTWFTHICHELPHAETCARLPAGLELAYDGLVLDIV